jgi:hypothetical protein
LPASEGKAESRSRSRERDCYLCARRILQGEKAISLPRLALEVHKVCYEYDVTRGIGPDTDVSSAA